ncbi:hypothetical protein Y032_0797g2402 [Ancylostoma ceylanicum]|uniref:Uncharacterized protein n=1 Tax=Ancylostoma ceylanicum TaxID=53326 RepID=A0A016WC06_9BILA|nr:hypothetical protein Y032_0797g2402 [Ancylostoma ceylanicum]
MLRSRLWPTKASITPGSANWNGVLTRYPAALGRSLFRAHSNSLYRAHTHSTPLRCSHEVGCVAHPK